MKNRLTLVKLDTEYCDYLRTFDNRVPYNYDKKNNRPFIGVLFKINKCMYFAPLSSPKNKHLTLKNKLYFLKIDKGKLGAINFNNMLPVTPINIKEINLNKKATSKMEEKYNLLLKEQIYWLNRHYDMLYRKSKTLYEKYINKTLSINIRIRCCDFKLLEEKCLEWTKEKQVLYN